MFWLLSKPFLIICLVVIDLLLITDIYNKRVVLNSTSPLVTRVLPKKNSVEVKIDNSEVAIKTNTITQEPSQTLTPSPTPINSPTPTQAPTPTQSSQQINQSSNQDGLTQLLSQANDFRSSKGLYAVSSNSQTCSFATLRAQEVSTSFNHDGFYNRISSKSLPYSSYSEVTENIALNSDQSQVVPGWIASPGHNENMQRDTPFVCIEKYGNYYVYEGWKP